MTSKPFVLIDGSSYFYRAFHALPPLSNTKGEPTGAVYGVINMIRKLVKDYQPDYVAVVFDAKGKTFRDALYPQYKATRPPTPDELQVQFAPLLAVIEAMGLPLLVINGVEADDVIGTLAHQASQQGMNTLISTGDKDMAQLVNDHVTLINTMTNVVMDEKGVVEKFGIKPSQIVDYLSLMGDKVDNVPGVDNVGPKTALKWLQQYGSLREISQHADEIGGKVGENLRRSLDFLPLSQQLIRIKTDVDLALTPSQLIPKAPDQKRLIQLFQALEFKRWLEEALNQEPSHNEKRLDTSYDTILTEEALTSWLKKLENSQAFAFDTETTSLDAITANLVGISFAADAHQAAYVPLAHDYAHAPAQLDRDTVLRALQPLLADSHKIKIGQNFKYDMSVLAKYGIDLAGPLYDTMLESYVLNSSASRHDMDTLSLKYLGQKTIKFEEVAGKGKKQLSFNQVVLEQAAPYAAEDADVTLQLHQALWPLVEKHPSLMKVFHEIDMPLVPVLSRMERHGVAIDSQLLASQSDVFGKRMDELQQQAFDLAGEVFNLSSPKQLQQILFEKLKLPALKKTPTGQVSTAEPVLQALAYDYPLPKVILTYRSLSKLKSTYLDALPKYVNKKTGRVHTSYHQAVTATGRLSSSDPNLQNIPVRTQEGRKIRQAFVADPGCCIIAADYSQIELRIMAHLSEDEGLCRAFANGWDIHRATAAEVNNIAIDDVTAEQRRHAKAVNFGLIYGMSAFGLSKQLGIERGQAQDYIDRYFDRYPGVKNYMQRTRELAHQQGYVETFYGRRLYLPDINARNLQRQRAAERAAINAPMQGTAADIIKIAMIHLDRWLQKHVPQAKMIMQVHDELVFEVPEKNSEQVSQQVTRLMCDPIALNVPIEVAVGVGRNWDEAH